MVNLLFIPMLAVMFLLDPEETVDVARLREISKDADRVEIASDGAPVKKARKKARITSETSDFDHKEGVALFEGNVQLAYGEDCVLCSDRIWAFATGSNQLDRVIATGNVSVTNETRYGTCSRAIFSRSRGEIEMFWDGSNTLARLVEAGSQRSELEGSRIKFWIDSEQVEVDSSRISTQTESNGSILR